MKIIRLFAILLCAISISDIYAQELPNWEWAKEINTFNSNGILGQVNNFGIVSDNEGSVFVAGTFQNEFLDTGADTLTRGIAGDAIFVIKYNSEGNILWTKLIGATLGQTNLASLIWDLSMTIDYEGNIILGGSFTRDLYFENNIHLINPFTNQQLYRNNRNAFVAKINTTGTTIWARQFGYNKDERINSIATDRFGNVYATGFFHSKEIIFGNDTLKKNFVSSSVAQYDELFIVKYSSQGQAQWIRGSKSGSLYRSIRGEKIVVDLNDEILVVGEFTTPTLLIDNFELTNNDSIKKEYGSSDLFFVKYNSDGHVISAKSLGGTITENIHNVLIDSNNDIVLTGSFNSAMLSFGNHYLANTNPLNFHVRYIVKLNSDLESYWMKKIEQGQVFTNIAIDKHRNIYTSQGFEKWVPVTDMIMIRKLNHMGEFESFIKVKCGGNDAWGGIMTIDPNDKVVVFSALSSNLVPLTAGNFTITKNGAIVAKAEFDNTLWFDKLMETKQLVTIFPNPAHSEVAIQNLPLGSTVSIKDVTGKTIVTTTALSKDINFNTNGFLAGIYFVQIEHNSKIYNHKLLVF